MTELAAGPGEPLALDVGVLLANIHNVDQVVSGVEGKARKVVVMIAESYKYAACILLRCRLLG